MRHFNPQSMRYLSLTTEQVDQLRQFYKTTSDHRQGQRAQALLLSQPNDSIPRIADLFEVDRDTLSRWMDRWQDQPRSARTPNLTDDQKSMVEWVRARMHPTREVAEAIQQRWQKTLSLSSLRQFFRSSKLSYKRIRRSCRQLRDQTAYPFLKQDWGPYGPGLRPAKLI